MIILKPIAHQTIWGGELLTRFFDEPHEKIGHLYSVLDEGAQSSLIENGARAGQSLHEYFVETKRHSDWSDTIDFRS